MFVFRDRLRSYRAGGSFSRGLVSRASSAISFPWELDWGVCRPMHSIGSSYISNYATSYKKYLGLYFGEKLISIASVYVEGFPSGLFFMFRGDVFWCNSDTTVVVV